MDENKELKEALKTLASKQGVTGRFTSLVTLENREAAALLAHIKAQDKQIEELIDNNAELLVKSVEDTEIMRHQQKRIDELESEADWLKATLRLTLNDIETLAPDRTIERIKKALPD
jgi:hypothetical protein